MKLKYRLATIALSAAGLFAVVPLSIAQPNHLFQEVDPPAAADAAAGRPEIVRSRYVAIDVDPLKQAQTSSEANTSQIDVNFFPDVVLPLRISRRETRGKNDYTVFGSLVDNPLSHCTIVVQDEKVTGNCSSATGSYQVRYFEGDVHVVHEIDQSQFPDEAEPIEVPMVGAPQIDAEPPGPHVDPDPLQDREVGADDAESDDDGSIVDMLVAYTTAAKNASSNIWGEIRLAVDETNQAYRNSNIPHRVRLVGTREVSYTESGSLCGSSSSDLTRLKGTSDGYMDNLHSLRNSTRADQVTLIVETGDACGCAYFMNPVSSSFESSAFSVIVRSCATGYFSFGHELGHNMSAHHDCYVYTGTSPYSYIHGFVHIGASQSQSWRTIMAYRNECQANGFSDCVRLQYFSNPSVSYNGIPMGTSGSGCTANNRLTHVNTDWTVSRFRQGLCTKSGKVIRLFESADAYSPSNYIYLREDALDDQYTYFRSSDDNIATTAAQALRKQSDVYIQGDQSCFDDTTDFGGEVDYMYVDY